MTRHDMTYRVVRLDSPEADEAPLARTHSEGSRMLAELSIAAWIAAGRELPTYTRATMPVRVTTLDAIDRD